MKKVTHVKFKKYVCFQIYLPTLVKDKINKRQIVCNHHFILQIIYHPEELTKYIFNSKTSLKEDFGRSFGCISIGK